VLIAWDFGMDVEGIFSVIVIIHRTIGIEEVVEIVSEPGEDIFVIAGFT
jgi:hypothetical protein